MAESLEHLKRDGRPLDREFDPDERVFRAVPRWDFLDDEGRLLKPGIRFPDISVNREKYSVPDDLCLLRDNCKSVVAVPVSGVPQEISCDRTGEIYRFRVEHVPLEKNYAHSEIQAFHDGEHLQDQPPKTVKNIFRQSICMKRVHDCGGGS